MDAEMPDYLRVNRDAWTKSNARYTDGRAEEAWAQAEIAWGVWQTPESAVKVLPGLRGRDVVELGCGTAYVGAWLKRRGARRVVGVDITPAQLATAQRLNRKSGMGLELIEANAEVGAARATVITYVNPAVALALGVAFLGEPLTIGIVLGFVLIVLGSVLATRRTAPSKSSVALTRSPDLL